MSVTIKLQLVVFAVVLLLIGVQTWLNIRNAQRRNEAETKQNLIALYNEFNEEIDLLESAAAALSLSFAHRPDIQERFQAKDRQGLLALLEPVFTSLQTDYNIVHLQFHEPNGLIFLRIHDPAHYGDYTFTYRRANAIAITSRQTVAGVEIDPNRLGIQAVSPMFYQGQFIGLVEVGLDYDQAFIEDLKVRQGVDYKMWVTYKEATPAKLGPVAGVPESPASEIFYYAGTSSTPLPIPAEVYQTVLRGGDPQIQFVSDGTQELAVLVAPMLGYGNRIIGILEISSSRTEALAVLQHNQRTTLIVAGGLALLALGLMWISAKLVVLRPLGHLTSVTRRQLEGDLTARVGLLPRDEFGQLGHTFNVLTETLDNTLKNQEKIITERTYELRATNTKLQQEIVERKQAEAEREQLIAELEAKNAQLERFTYTVSHDLKSPLVTINGFLGFLEKDVAKGDTVRIQGDIQRIRGAAEKMGQLLEALLEVSRIGRLVNPPEVIPLDELAREAAALVAGQITERGVQITIAPNLPAVYGDRPRLVEVWQNLIDNAVKFMGDQSDPHIEIGAKQRSDENVYYVRDNGIGIAPQYHEKIFDLFNRLDQSVDGTGIGLALAKRIVEVHGGRIWVESEGKGKGSTFYLTLPWPG